MVAVGVHLESERSAAFRTEWERWNPGVRLDMLLPATVLRARTDVVVCTLPYRLTSR